MVWVPTWVFTFHVGIENANKSGKSVRVVRKCRSCRSTALSRLSASNLHIKEIFLILFYFFQSTGADIVFTICASEDQKSKTVGMRGIPLWKPTSFLWLCHTSSVLFPPIYIPRLSFTTKNVLLSSVIKKPLTTKNKKENKESDHRATKRAFDVLAVFQYIPFTILPHHTHTPLCPSPDHRARRKVRSAGCPLLSCSRLACQSSAAPPILCLCPHPLVAILAIDRCCSSFFLPFLLFAKLFKTSAERDDNAIIFKWKTFSDGEK